MEFPRMVYRSGGPWALESGNYSVKNVSDADDLKASQADGWFLDQYAAKGAHEAAQQPADTAAQTDEEVQQTRADMEAQARLLGVKFDGRVGDKTLADRIAKARG